MKQQNINQDYFKTWSNNMAYVLGFCTARARIHDITIFDLTIKKKDKYILKRIASEISFKGCLSDTVDNQLARLNFCCRPFCEQLAEFWEDGWAVPTEFRNDFIRGFFDGNGKVVNVKGHRINAMISCFNEQTAKQFKHWMGIDGGTQYKDKQMLVFGNRDSLLLGKFMYKNNPELFLSRKREKFQL